ncbi:MAG: GAF domain-containing protein [Cyanophyceae cyanobacterium]
MISNPNPKTQSVESATPEGNKLLATVALQTRSSLNLEEILETTAAEVRKLLQTDRVVVYRLYDNGRGRVVVESVDDRWMSILNCNVEDNCFVNEWGDKFKQGEVTANSDIDEGISPCHAELLKSLQVRANLAVPLLQGEKLWGLLIAHHCSKPRQWQKAEIEILQRLAVQVAIALQQAELYQQARLEVERFKRLEKHLRRVNRSVKALSDCNQAVIKATNVTELLHKISQILVEVGGYCLAWACVENECLDSRGTIKELEKNRCCQDVTKLSEARKPHELEVIQNLETELPRTDWSRTMSAEGCQAFATVPLKVGDRRLGTLTIGAPEPNVFDEAEIELLSELADNIAYGIAAIEARMALEKTNEVLEQKVQERTAELQQANQQLQLKVEEQKRTAAELRNFAQRVEQSNRELQDFAYIASHDLQEPLRKIAAFGDRLMTKYGHLLPQQGVDYLERMQSAARRMHKLINNLLDFSRITTKAKPFTAVDLNKVIQEVLLDLEIQIARTGGTVKVDQLATIEADSSQMYRLLQNLLSNALKYSRPDEPPRVRIRGHQLNEQYQIFVEDNGIGFDEKYLDKIFTIFQRLHDRTTYEGTGIGLAICRKITERHGGTITARSQPSQGATFIVTLPIKQSLIEINE